MNQQLWCDPSLPFVESRRAWQSRACYRLHTHPTVSIGAVDAGRSVLTVDGLRTQALEAGDVVIISANRAHACNPEQGSAWTYQMLYLDAGWVAHLRSEHEGENAGGKAGPALPTHFRDPDCYQRFCALNELLFEDLPAAVKEGYGRDKGENYTFVPQPIDGY